MTHRVQDVGDGLVVDLRRRLGLEVAEAQVVVHIDEAGQQTALAEVEHLRVRRRAEVGAAPEGSNAAGLAVDQQRRVVDRRRSRPVKQAGGADQEERHAPLIVMQPG